MYVFHCENVILLKDRETDEHKTHIVKCVNCKGKKRVKKMIKKKTNRETERKRERERERERERLRERERERERMRERERERENERAKEARGYIALGICEIRSGLRRGV